MNRFDKSAANGRQARSSRNLRDVTSIIGRESCSQMCPPVEECAWNIPSCHETWQTEEHPADCHYTCYDKQQCCWKPNFTPHGGREDVVCGDCAWISFK